VNRPETADPGGHGGWTRAMVIVVRVALLVFLLWTLYSSHFSERTPVAGDPPPTPAESHSSAVPCSDAPSRPV
jgi:hypothetical protein